MVNLDRFDKKLLYKSLELHALEQARKASDPTVRTSWELAADSWRQLAAMVPERCFCGKAAIGTKYYAGGGAAAYCGEHLHEALMRELCERMGFKSDN